jgi:hypothetical protein
MVDSDEQRSFRRMSIECPVNFRRERAEGTYAGTVRNLSGRGLLLNSHELLQLGDRLEVDIRPANALTPSLHAIVEVVRVEPGATPGSCDAGCSILEILD